MHKVEVANRTLYQHLIWCHSESRHDTTSEKGIVVLRECSPDAAYEHDDYGDDEDGSSTPHFGERVRDEEGEADTRKVDLLASH